MLQGFAIFNLLPGGYQACSCIHTSPCVKVHLPMCKAMLARYVMSIWMLLPLLFRA